MGTLGLVLIVVFLTGCISWMWVSGIDYMHTNHPDYKGEDFLNWDKEDVDTTKVAGRDGWDDNLVHTEGGF